MKGADAVVDVDDFGVTFNPCCCPGSVSHRHQWNAGAAEPRETLVRVSGFLKPLSGDGRGEERLCQGALTGVCVCVCFPSRLINQMSFQYQCLIHLCIVFKFNSNVALGTSVKLFVSSNIF